MTGVTYYSDGKYLNATIWLSGPFQEKPSPISRVPLYGMSIGIIEPYNMSVGVDYAALLQWNLPNRTWTRTIEDFLGNDTRTLIQDNVDRNFFNNTGNKGKVNLSLDLESISSPDQFLLFFSAYDGIIERGNACGFVDIIENAIQIPPPQFSVSTFPSPLEIRHGEEKTMELKINSRVRSNALVKFAIPYNPEQIPDGMTITIEPEETNVTAAGVASSRITVKVSDEVTPTSYSPQVNSTFTLPIIMNSSSFVESLSEKKANESQNSSGINVTSIETKEPYISPMSLSPRQHLFQ